MIIFQPKKYLLSILGFLLLTAHAGGSLRAQDQDYLVYHQQVMEAEARIAEGNFEQALKLYEEVFDRFAFAFLRDLKIASQLAWELDDPQRAASLIRKGISAGWELRDLKKHAFLSPIKQSEEWKGIETDYPQLRKSYESRIDQSTREQVRKLFKKDQRKAMGALFRLGDQAQEKYALKKFAPHSEAQLQELKEIVETKGYPGERLIGNDYWASTILSHHNSISRDYALRDTLYSNLKPELQRAVRKGEMSPYEFALADDWCISVSSGHKAAGYGFLSPPAQSTLEETNRLREHIGLRSIELRNVLVETEQRTGMNFYLPDWVKGRIAIEAH